MKRAEEGFERIVSRIEKVAPERPIGSEKVDDEELMQDYLLARDDPEQLGLRLEKFKQQYGRRKGVLTFAEWISNMERRLA